MHYIGNIVLIPEKINMVNKKKGGGINYRYIYLGLTDIICIQIGNKLFIIMTFFMNTYIQTLEIYIYTHNLMGI